MQPAHDSAQSSPTAQSSGRGLISRFTSGLTSKSRSVVDFHIKLDDEGKRYTNGDTIKGSLRLKIVKAIRITHITVSLSGRAHVYRHPTAPGAFHRSNGGHNTSSEAKSTGQYHGNGLATLFEEEAVLCGDGRLAESSYHFNFELSFPARGLPSSVDFERGKISYAISAALTRPTTIAPVLNCERVVYFNERIDIAVLYPPKPRTIVLDSLSKRSKAKDQALKVTGSRDRKSKGVGHPNGSSQTSIRPSQSSQEIDRSRSPVSSVISVDSHISSSDVQSQSESISVSASPTASLVSRPTRSISGQRHKTINTTIESCSGGCLRGDQATVKVHVNHTKYMKSMNGVLVTLYRHAHVDTQPALPIGPIEKGKTDSRQSYHLTGLGGLSLSGAGSAHIFRKDLAQAVFPLVINPTTLTADVLAKVRVPEEAFPTISGVPGSMISFKYYIEVIVDIQGKLSTPTNPLHELTSTNMSPSESYETDYSNTAAHPSRILDTSYVRRDKGVVCSAFEIIIGTEDSERKKGKQKLLVVDESHEEMPTQPMHPPAFENVQPLIGHTANGFLAGHYAGSSSATGRLSSHTQTSGTDDSAGVYALAIPPFVDESQLPEKERVRLAEARLLPSQPPGLEDETDRMVHDATAPQLDDDYDTAMYSEPAPQDEYWSRDGEGWPTAAQEHQLAPDMSPLDSSETATAVGTAQAVDHSDAIAADSSGQTHMHDSHGEASALLSDLPRYER